MKITNSYYNLRSLNKQILQAAVSDLKSLPLFSCGMQGVCYSPGEFLKGYQLLLLHIEYIITIIKVSLITSGHFPLLPDIFPS